MFFRLGWFHFISKIILLRLVLHERARIGAALKWLNSEQAKTKQVDKQITNNDEKTQIAPLGAGKFWVFETWERGPERDVGHSRTEPPLGWGGVLSRI